MLRLIELNNPDLPWPYTTAQFVTDNKRFFSPEELKELLPLAFAMDLYTFGIDPDLTQSEVETFFSLLNRITPMFQSPE